MGLLLWFSGALDRFDHYGGVPEGARLEPVYALAVLGPA